MRFYIKNLINHINYINTKGHKCALLILIVSFVYFTFPILGSKYDSNLLWNSNQYDGHSVIKGLENNLNDGIFKNYFFQNRKGHLQMDYFHPYPDGCTLISKNIAPKIYTYKGELKEQTTLKNDCIYAHYPPLVDIFYYTFAKIGLIKPSSFNSIAIFVSIINSLSMMLVFILLAHYFKNGTHALLSTIIVLLSPGLLYGAFDIYYRSFELLFFLLQLYSFTKQRTLSFYIFCLLGVNTGFDLAIPTLTLLFLYKDNLGKLRKLILLLLMFGPQIFLRFLLKFNDDGFIKHVFATIRNRSGGIFNYPENLIAYITNLNHLLKNQFINEGLLLTLILFVIYQSRKNRKHLVVLLFLIFSAINIGLILPVTSTLHSWTKMKVFVLPLAFLFCLALSYAPKLKNKLLFPIVIIFYFIINKNIFEKTFYSLKSVNDINKTNKESINKIDQILIYRDSPLPWNMINQYKSIFLPVINIEKNKEYLFNWPYPITYPLQNGIYTYQFHLKESSRIKSLKIIYTGKQESILCSIYDFEKEIKIANTSTFQLGPSKTSYSSLSIKFEIPLNTKVFKIQCNLDNTSIRRIWLNE